MECGRMVWRSVGGWCGGVWEDGVGGVWEDGGVGDGVGGVWEDGVDGGVCVKDGVEECGRMAHMCLLQY